MQPRRWFWEVIRHWIITSCVTDVCYRIAYLHGRHCYSAIIHMHFLCDRNMFPQRYNRGPAPKCPPAPLLLTLCSHFDICRLNHYGITHLWNRLLTRHRPELSFVLSSILVVSIVPSLDMKLTSTVSILYLCWSHHAYSILYTPVGSCPESKEIFPTKRRENCMELHPKLAAIVSFFPIR